MKICILDGYTLNPGDLSWAAIEALGECHIYERTAPEEVVNRASGAVVLLTNKVVISEEIMSQLPELKYVGVLATGYNVVDIEAARKRGIVVTNIPAYSTMSVAQMVFAHLLNIAVSVEHYNMNKESWVNSKDFCYYDTNLIELAGKTMGIVGLGNTGMATAKIALAFGMNVIAVTSKPKEELPEGIEPVGYDMLFSDSDVISLNCPLTEKTKGLVNADNLKKVKPTAIIINTGRGPLVVDADVADALNNGKLAAFAADVMTVEPPASDNCLMSAKNVFLTPHIAWATKEARQRLMAIAADNISGFISGNPVNIVNK